MALHRMMAPNNVATTAVVNGRTYSVAAGGTVDVPDFDADILEANGWVKGASTGGGGVGATAARPANPQRHQEFLDTTLNVIIRFDGKAWRNPATGAAV